MENKQKIALHVLGLGLAITFILVGVYILRDPIGWSGFLKPWAQNLLIFSPKDTMVISGWSDIAIGILLLLSRWQLIILMGSILATLHMIIVLITSGVNAVTVRDIATFGSALALVLFYWPQKKVDAPKISELP